MLKECSKVVEMMEPYVPGFLAFREVNYLLDRMNDLEINHPEFKPQVSRCVYIHVCVHVCVCVCMCVHVCVYVCEVIMGFTHVAFKMF